MAEFAEFALDALIAPGRVLPGHSFDQHGDGLVEGWATAAVGVGPLPAHEAAMPAQDRGWGDQAMPAQHRWEAPDQRGEQGSVGPVQAGLGVGSAQYRDLVAQHEQLNVLRRRGAGKQYQPAEEPTQDQVEQA